MSEARTAFDPKNHDFANPDPWLALALDQSTFFDQSAKEALLRNNGTWSRVCCCRLSAHWQG